MQIVFHRHYEKPIEKVWAALTVPERLADWLALSEIEMRVGGVIKLDWHGHNTMEGKVVILDPPHVFAWTWPFGGRETLVRFELKAEGDGCSLTLTHTNLSLTAGARAGWHAHLEGLDDAMEGLATPWSTVMARMDVLKPRYPNLA